jgi:hypothetical protein
MRSLIYLILLMVSIPVFSQENPWTPKGENPWVAYENNSANQTAEQVVIVIIDTVQLEETSEQKMSEADYNQLMNDLKADVIVKYQNGKDFGVGFGIGIVFGFTGIVGDGIYALTNSKREKKVVEEILIDSTYQVIPDEVLTKETKKTMRGKKIAKAIGGTMVAVLVRITVFGAIILTSF